MAKNTAKAASAPASEGMFRYACVEDGANLDTAKTAGNECGTLLYRVCEGSFTDGKGGIGRVRAADGHIAVRNEDEAYVAGDCAKHFEVEEKQVSIERISGDGPHALLRIHVFGVAPGRMRRLQSEDKRREGKAADVPEFVFADATGDDGLDLDRFLARHESVGVYRLIGPAGGEGAGAESYDAEISAVVKPGNVARFKQACAAHFGKKAKAAAWESKELAGLLTRIDGRISGIGADTAHEIIVGFDPCIGELLAESRHENAGETPEKLSFVRFRDEGPSEGKLREACAANPGTVFYGLDDYGGRIRGKACIRPGLAPSFKSDLESHFGLPMSRTFAFESAPEGYFMLGFDQDACRGTDPGETASDPDWDAFMDRKPKARSFAERYGDMMAKFALPPKLVMRCVTLEGGAYQDLCLMEECGEVIKEITKAARHPGRDGKYLEEEIGDLLFTIQTAIANHRLDADRIAESIAAKARRTEKILDEIQTKSGNAGKERR